MATDSQDKKPFLRLFSPITDYEAIEHIFRETANPALKREPHLTIAHHIWCFPYTVLAPQLFYVLDDGTGRAVGYINGTPDTRQFVDDWREKYLPSLDQARFPKPDADQAGTTWKDEIPVGLLELLWGPEHMLFEELAGSDLMDRYPAHLHIDILPEFQRKGFGRMMVEAFCKELKAVSGAKGIHLVTIADNVAGQQFYGRVGFKRYDQVLDGGESGETGHASNETRCLVKEL